jgi:hypothetical protein
MALTLSALGLIDDEVARICGSRCQGCTEVKSTSKHWPCLFPQHGPGRKHDRTIELAPWQRAIVEAHPGDFARGLFHSDGWRGVNRVRRPLADGDRWYEYARYRHLGGAPRRRRAARRVRRTQVLTGRSARA